MTEPSDTPLDAIIHASLAVSDIKRTSMLIDHARQLERDLAAARAEVVRLTSAYARLSEQMIDSNLDRDRLAAARAAGVAMAEYESRRADENARRVETIEAERDRLAADWNMLRTEFNAVCAERDRLANNRDQYRRDLEEAHEKIAADGTSRDRLAAELTKTQAWGDRVLSEAHSAEAECAALKRQSNADLLPLAHLFQLDGLCLEHEIFRCEKCRYAALAQEKNLK